MALYGPAVTPCKAVFSSSIVVFAALDHRTNMAEHNQGIHFGTGDQTWVPRSGSSVLGAVRPNHGAKVFGGSCELHLYPMALPVVEPHSL